MRCKLSSLSVCCALALCYGTPLQAQEDPYYLPEAIDAIVTGDRDFLRSDLDLYPLRLNYVLHFAKGLSQACEGFHRREAGDFKKAVALMREAIRPRLPKKGQVHLALGRIFAEDDLAYFTSHYECSSQEIRSLEVGLRAMLYPDNDGIP